MAEENTTVTTTTTATTPAASTTPKYGTLIKNGRRIELTKELLDQMRAGNVSDRRMVTSNIGREIDLLAQEGNTGYWDNNGVLTIVDKDGNHIHTSQDDYGKRGPIRAFAGALANSRINEENDVRRKIFDALEPNLAENAAVDYDKVKRAYNDFGGDNITIGLYNVKGKKGQKEAREGDLSYINAINRLNEALNYSDDSEGWLQNNRFKKADWKTYLDSDFFKNMYSAAGGREQFLEGLKQRIRTNTLDEKTDKPFLNALNIYLGDAPAGTAGATGGGTTGGGVADDGTEDGGLTGGIRIGGDVYKVGDNYYTKDGNAVVFYDPQEEYIGRDK